MKTYSLLVGIPLGSAVTRGFLPAQFFAPLCLALALQRSGLGHRLWGPLLWGCMVAVGLANLQQVMSPTPRLYSHIPHPAIARDAVAAASERQLRLIAISRHTLNALSVERFARPHLAAGQDLRLLVVHPDCAAFPRGTFVYVQLMQDDGEHSDPRRACAGQAQVKVQTLRTYVDVADLAYNHLWASNLWERGRPCGRGPAPDRDDPRRVGWNGPCLDVMRSPTAILQVICPDRPGLVSELSGWVAANGGNIVHADHHTDAGAGVFLSRIEWELQGFGLPREALAPAVQSLASRLGGSGELHFSDAIPRVAIFVSRQSHCLVDLLWRTRAGELPMVVPLVISNHPDLRHDAEAFGARFVHLPVNAETRAEVEHQQLALLREHGIELAILAKYMQVLSPGFLESFGPVINIHHSFLPAFQGAQPYHRAWERGVKLIGATAHFVTEELDAGPIIEQSTVHVSHRDEVEDLIRKGRDTERLALARAVRLVLRRQVMVYRGRTAVFD